MTEEKGETVFDNVDEVLAGKIVKHAAAHSEIPTQPQPEHPEPRDEEDEPSCCGESCRSPGLLSFGILALVIAAVAYLILRLVRRK